MIGQTNNKQQTTNTCTEPVEVTNNKQQTTNNKPQTTNNKQQTTNPDSYRGTTNNKQQISRLHQIYVTDRAKL
jgi:hypothetical protein